jgi:hypothetical protein
MNTRWRALEVYLHMDQTPYLNYSGAK